MLRADNRLICAVMGLIPPRAWLMRIWVFGAAAAPEAADRYHVQLHESRSRSRCTCARSNTCRRWVFTVCGEMYSRLATAPFVSLSATSSDTARSVAVRLCQPPVGRCLDPRGPGRTPKAL